MIGGFRSFIMHWLGRLSGIPPAAHLVITSQTTIAAYTSSTLVSPPTSTTVLN